MLAFEGKEGTAFYVEGLLPNIQAGHFNVTPT